MIARETDLMLAERNSAAGLRHVAPDSLRAGRWRSSVRRSSCIADVHQRFHSRRPNWLPRRTTASCASGLSRRTRQPGASSLPSIESGEASAGDLHQVGKPAGRTPAVATQAEFRIGPAYAALTPR